FAVATGCAHEPPTHSPRPSISEIDVVDYCRALPDACFTRLDTRIGEGCPEPNPYEIPFEHGSADIVVGHYHLFPEITRDRADWKTSVRLELVSVRDLAESAEIDARRIATVRRELIQHGIDEARILTAPPGRALRRCGTGATCACCPRAAARRDSRRLD